MNICVAVICGANIFVDLSKKERKTNTNTQQFQASSVLIKFILQVFTESNLENRGKKCLIV